MEGRTDRRIVVRRRGGPEVLEVARGEVARPSPGEVRVRTLAAGVSAMDLMVRSSWFPGFPRLPFTPGVDLVGVVDEVGEGASPVGVGQTVAALLGTDGGYAESVCLPASRAVEVPSGVDPAEAVCLVANYLTAAAMLERAAEVRSGERILVQGAAGGVGTALLELGAIERLEMYGTASPRNHELVASLGATPIDYHADDVPERVLSLTGDGVDAAFDPIGGGRQLRRSYRALRPSGRLVWFGVAAASRSGTKVIPLSLATRFVLSLIPDGKRAPMPPDASEPNDWYRAKLAALLASLAAGRLHPIVADRIPLSEASRAHQVLERGGHAGKVVLLTEPRSSTAR
jgi:NADPH:quinone reductase-like Zn-dependent oxidoreductase